MTDDVGNAGAGGAYSNRWQGAIRDAIRYTPSGDTIPEETWERRHRNILVVALAHLPLLLALGLFEGTESITGAEIPSFPLPNILGALAIILGLTGLAAWSGFGRRLRTALATAALLTCSAVMVFLSGGFIEAHFHFFVMMAVVAVYEDWLPFLLGIAYVAVQHGVFGTIDHSLVYNHEAAISNPVPWAIIHATFILALSVALVALWHSTERSREEALDQRRQAELLEERKAEVEAAKERAERAQAEAEARETELRELNDRLERTAETYSAKMALAADGQLGVRLDPDVENEAMARIAEACNEMLAETETAVGEIQSFTTEVAAASEQANAGVQEVEQASEEVSDSVQEISVGADEQREMLEDVFQGLNDLSATVEEVASAADAVSETSRETAEVAQEGTETAQQAIADVRAGRAAVDSTVDRVEALDERMTEIGEIIDLLSEIARQTNLLALNANIEAARVEQGTGSGDGEGFGVVADEVKQLAEETQQSATEIEQLIQATQAETQETVAEARQADQYMEEGVAAVETVVDAFEQVAENTAETNNGVQEISTAADEQADSTEAVVARVDEVTDISRTTAEEAERVSAAAEEQTSSMLEVSSTVGALADQAEQLEGLLSAFEVDGATDDPAAETVAVRDGGPSD